MRRALGITLLLLIFLGSCYGLAAQYQECDEKGREVVRTPGGFYKCGEIDK